MVKEFNLSRLSDAMIAYRVGCTRGDLGSCTLLATAARTKVKPPDVANTRWALNAACTLRDGSACNSLGSIYTDATYGIDYAKAIEAFGKGCDLGRVKACDNLRLVYSEPGYSRVNIDTARDFFDRAYRLDQGVVPACSGFATACGTLADHYGKMPRTRLDDIAYGLGKKIWRLAQPACDGGYTQVCLVAGHMSAYREPPLKTEDRRLYAKGCAANDAKACAWLGRALLQTAPGPVDPVGSREAYAKACRLGVATACKTPPSPN
jgi:TPR repeat protein